MVHTCTNMVGTGCSNITVGPMGRKGGLHSRMGCIYTLMIYRETRAMRRNSERQPFARISITNTHQTAGDHRNRNRGGHRGNGKTCEENKGRRENVMGCHSLLLAEIQAMMQGDDVVNGRGEEVPKGREPMATACP